MNDEIIKDRSLSSSCCGAAIYCDTDICSDCKEHCEVEIDRPPVASQYGLLIHFGWRCTPHKQISDEFTGKKCELCLAYQRPATKCDMCNGSGELAVGPEDSVNCDECGGIGLLLSKTRFLAI